MHYSNYSYIQLCMCSWRNTVIQVLYVYKGLNLSVSILYFQVDNFTPIGSLKIINVTTVKFDACDVQSQV